MSTGRWRSGFSADVVLAVAVGAALWLAVVFAPEGSADLGPLGYFLLPIGPLAIIGTRRAPLATLSIITAWTLAFHLRIVPGLTSAVPIGVVTAFPVLIAVYQAVRAQHRWAAIAASSSLVLGVLVVAAFQTGGHLTRELVQTRLLLAGWLVAAGVSAEVYRQHSAYLQQVEQRAEQAERTKEEAARHRADEERLRIARELHDSLTHSISIIKVQANVAIHLARKRGEEIPESLLAIQEASTDAIRELRTTLEVLRRPTTDTAGGNLVRLPYLVERSRQAGTPAELTVSGERCDLPMEVDGAAYRIVQEALTNVARHAGQASASIHISYRPDTLTVKVDDDGEARPDELQVPGVGLIGMRERVAALGGSLHAGPRPEGGFTVHAELPVRAPA